jgi:hypothetical protein
VLDEREIVLLFPLKNAKVKGGRAACLFVFLFFEAARCASSELPQQNITVISTLGAHSTL